MTAKVLHIMLNTTCSDLCIMMDFGLISALRRVIYQSDTKVARQVLKFSQAERVKFDICHHKHGSELILNFYNYTEMWSLKTKYNIG